MRRAAAVSIQRAYRAHLQTLVRRQVEEYRADLDNPGAKNATRVSVIRPGSEISKALEVEALNHLHRECTIRFRPHKTRFDVQINNGKRHQCSGFTDAFESLVMHDRQIVDTFLNGNGALITKMKHLLSIDQFVQMIGKAALRDSTNPEISFLTAEEAGINIGVFSVLPELVLPRGNNSTVTITITIDYDDQGNRRPATHTLTFQAKDLYEEFERGCQERLQASKWMSKTIKDIPVDTRKDTVFNVDTTRLQGHKFWVNNIPDTCSTMVVYVTRTSPTKKKAHPELVLMGIDLRLTVPFQDVVQEDECCICLDTLVGKACWDCTECSGSMHRSCITAWSQQYTTCPLCRTELQLDN